MALLFFISSCALFRGESSLQNKSTDELLSSVKVTGEGKGRLGLDQSQYVFSVDSVLKDKKDWILAVSIPLQGEEVMIFPDLQQKTVNNPETESFEQRIRYEFKHRRLERKIPSDVFIQEMRSVLRFILANELSLKRSCTAEKGNPSCEFEGEKYSLEVKDKTFSIKKSLGTENQLVVIGRNLTGSIFTKTDFLLYTSDSKTPAFSLELFW